MCRAARFARAAPTAIPAASRGPCKDTPEVEGAITWYGDGNVLSDDTSTRLVRGLPAEWALAFAPGAYRIVALDRDRGLRGEQSFRIDPGDPSEGRIEVVLR